MAQVIILMSCPKRVLEEVLDEMQRKRGEYMKKKDEEQNAGIVDRIHWKVQGVRQYLFSKSLRKDRSGGEGSAGDDGGDDTVIWKYFSEYCSIKEEQDNDDKVMGE